MVIAIDFDGTCVTHEYPNVGKEIGAVPVLKDLVAAGHKLILFTMRSNKPGISPITKVITPGGLQDAIDWFDKHGITLFAIQQEPNQHTWTESPKCWANYMIDDIAIGTPLIEEPGYKPYVDWVEMRQMLEDRGLL
jgi:hypothetical protein